MLQYPTIMTNKITITTAESMICKLDGLVFKSSRKMLLHVKEKYNLTFEQYVIKVYYNGIYPTCLKTGKQLTFKPNKLGPWFADYAKNCFPRTAHSTETKEKIKESCEKGFVNKYGVKNPFQLESVKKKIRETNFKKYGVANPMQANKFKRFCKRCPESVARAMETNYNKYGNVTYSSTDEGKTKIKLSLFKRNYIDWPEYEDVLKKRYVTIITPKEDFFSNTSNKFKCDIDGHEWLSENTLPRCAVCEATHRFARSGLESSFFSFLDTLEIDYSKNKRFDSVYELDVYIESLSIGIEINGLFWHSEKNGKDKKYHIDKLNFFNKKGIRVVQIFEDEWVFNKTIVENKIKKILKTPQVNMRKIHPRKCVIKNIRYKECIDFLTDSHVQGATPTPINIGAFYNDELISVMTFSRNRLATNLNPNQNTAFELVRFAVKNDVSSAGLFGKLIKFFIRENNPEKIISYADKRFTDKENNIYVNNGFECVAETSPNYWYVKGYKREHRLKYRKQNLIKSGYSIDKSERQIMEERGYTRAWDCGQFRFELVLS